MDFYKQLKDLQLSKAEFRKVLWKWELIKDVQAKKKLICHFLPLGLKIATKFSKRYGIELFDLFSQCYILIDKAISFYKKEKATLSTFVYLYLHWELKNYINETFSPVRYPYKTKKEMKDNGTSMNAVSLSELDYDIPVISSEEALILKEERKMLDYIEDNLTEEEFRALTRSKISKKLKKKIKSLLFSKGYEL